LESYKKPPHPLSCLFVIVYFFLLQEAINESTLDKLKKEAREREFEKKVETTMREQVDRERAKHISLIGVIYIKPLALHEPTIEELKILSKNKKVGSWKKN
jgi:hypothetical protein